MIACSKAGFVKKKKIVNVSGYVMLVTKSIVIYWLPKRMNLFVAKHIDAVPTLIGSSF